MDNNVLVIGNGYDLAHGLRTKYEHFIEWIADLNIDFWNTIATLEHEKQMYDRIKENGFVLFLLEYKRTVAGWVDVEHLINSIINDFDDFFSNELDFVDGRGRIELNVLPTSADVKKKRIVNCIIKFPIVSPSGGMGGKLFYELKEKFYSANYGINKKEVVSLLKSQLDELILLLQMYLKVHTSEEKSHLKVKKQLDDIKPDYIISFNYTDTSKIYGINDENVLYVHGNVKQSNMVLGYNDEVDNWDFVYFKKYFQRIQKLTGCIDRNKMIKYEDGFEVRPLIHFYGHSLDNSDGDIIRELRSIAIGFRIYRYNQEDYEQKVINLFDVFGREDAIRMIQDGYIQFIDCEA